MGKTKSRGNKLGSVFKRKDRGTWTAQVILGWRAPENPDRKMIPIKKTLGGFRTKAQALEALHEMLNGDLKSKEKVSLNDVYKAWKSSYEHRVTVKTMEGYTQAYKHFETLHFRDITTITAKELQDCMDRCIAGKRTHQLMKVVVGLIWHFAIDAEVVQKDVTRNLYIGKHQTTTREPLSDEDIEKIKGAIGQERYAEYIYALCYLGFRPGEMLELKKSQVYTQKINDNVVHYIIGGKKTQAGTNRIVVIPDQIAGIVLDRLFVPGTDLLFPLYVFSRNKKHTFIEFREMSHNYFNNFVFKPMSQELGIENKVPYSARHTYADKLKKATGDNKDKAALIGHTDYDFTQHRYQSTQLEDLKAIVDSFE